MTVTSLEERQEETEYKSDDELDEIEREQRRVSNCVLSMMSWNRARCFVRS